MTSDWKIFGFNDIHTHVPGPGRVVSIDITDPNHKRLIDDSEVFTAGVHPWNSDHNIDWDYLFQVLQHPKVVGIGEAGLDALRGPEHEIQMEAFMRQISMAERLHLPLVIHSVKSNHRLLELKKKLQPTVPWIIHGFRGNQAQAEQLIRAGMHLSINEKVNIQTLIGLPDNMIHYESDEEVDNKSAL